MVSPPFGNNNKKRIARLKCGGSDTYVKVGLSSFIAFSNSWKGIIIITKGISIAPIYTLSRSAGRRTMTLTKHTYKTATVQTTGSERVSVVDPNTSKVPPITLFISTKQT